MTNTTYPNNLPMTLQVQCSYCPEVHTATREKGANFYAGTYLHGHHFYGVVCPNHIIGGRPTSYGIHEKNDHILPNQF